jgi:hypothetical protein
VKDKARNISIGSTAGLLVGANLKNSLDIETYAHIVSALQQQDNRKKSSNSNGFGFGRYGEIVTFWRKTTQTVTVLLVLLMSTMLVLPPGMDIELCFGEDGHFDFSLNSCQDGISLESPSRENSSVCDPAGHGECLNVTVICGTAQELIRTDGKSDSYKSDPKKDPSQTPLFFSESLADFAGPYLDPNVYPIPFEDFLSPHLVSLRTVILLI